jgi:hypothetical protein
MRAFFLMPRTRLSSGAVSTIFPPPTDTSLLDEGVFTPLKSFGQLLRLDNKLSLQGCEFGRHKVPNCRRRNEIFSNVFVTSRRVRREFSAHNAKQAFAIWIENSGS